MGTPGPPHHALPTHQDKSSSRAAPHASTPPPSSQHNQLLDWQQTSAFEPTADLFQSFGVDASSLGAPLTNDWLFGGGCGFGDGSSSSGGEGDGVLDVLSFGEGDQGIDGGLGDIGVDWSLPELGTVNSPPIMGGEVSPASLDDLLPAGDFPTGDTALFFNPLPGLAISSTAPSLSTSEAADHFSMSPSSAMTFNHQQPLPQHHQQQHHPQQQQQIPTSGPGGARRRSPPADPLTQLKRQRNNIAARKYRQKRIDRISELELELDGVKQERDDLKIRLARQEAETAALRSMLRMQSGEVQYG
ncbi:hypothetical protein F5Y17DRAFT_474170 [Xylariaceae sp. FL0594]|nr:hypothetical protein F5Y17DRAFT_474170 [Xylariaceae sp. FL0594]